MTEHQGTLNLASTPAESAFYVCHPPQTKYLLKITPAFTVTQPTRPNRWVRMWHRLLLGWRWERIDNDW